MNQWFKRKNGDNNKESADSSSVSDMQAIEQHELESGIQETDLQEERLFATCTLLVHANSHWLCRIHSR